MFYIDPLYIFLMLPAMLLGFTAQIYVSNRYSKYSRIPNTKGITGSDVVQMIVQHERFNINLQIHEGEMSDSYNPFNRNLQLSAGVSQAPSVASVAIAAHEMGHVAQHQNGAKLFSLKSFIAPSIRIVANVGYVLLIAGLILAIFNLALVGIALFSLTSVFALITLPIEIDASKRALAFIKKYNLLTSPVEYNGAKQVLTAAAFTYLAATVQSLSTLVYFFLRTKGINKD